MKRAMCWLLGLAMTLVSSLAFANATAFTVTGTVSTQTGTAAPRPVRQGDTIPAGDTVSTAAGATVVLRFPDGQIAALTPNSRLTITTYQYNEQAKTGNVLLSLISGGMRAITGLIGKTSPEKVSYRAATATIGIRGTITNFALAGADLSVDSEQGTVTVTINNQTTILPAGQVLSFISGQVSTGPRGSTGLSPALAAILGATSDPSFISAVAAAVSGGAGGGASGGGSGGAGDSPTFFQGGGSSGGGGTTATPTPTPTPNPPPS